MTSTAATAPVATDLTWIGGNRYAREYATVTQGTRLLAQVGDDTYREVCGRCGGRGFRSEYAGIYAGECFECRYVGLSGKARTLADFARLDRANARSLARQDAARAAAWEAGRAEREAAEREEMHAEALRDNAAIDRARASRWVGKEGAKVTVVGTVGLVIETEGYAYNSPTGRMVIVNGTGDDAGVTVKITGTSAWLYEAEKGEAVTVTGTVKAHATYKDVAQTVLIRTKRA